MARAGRACADWPGIANGGAVVHRYGELADRVARLAGALRRRCALQQSDRVAIALRNCPEYLEILYACWHAGLLAVPINVKLHPSELDFILKDSGARLCFTSAALGAQIATPAGADLRFVIEVGSADYAQMLFDEPLPLTDCRPDDPAWLFYTSGTTGRPKGAVLSHHNLLAMSLCYFADVDRQGPWRAILHVAPLSHGSGLYALPHVMQASCHVMPQSDSFDADEVYALIGAWPHAVFFAAPTMLKRLVDHPREYPTGNLKTILYGGGPMYLEDLLAGIERLGYKFAQLYGQGESPMTITALSAAVIAETRHPRWRERISSVGIAQSAVEVRTIDEAGQALPWGEIGEVVVRGATVMSGYWNNPAASAQTLRGGWLHTGDLGSFDPEGFLTLKDRCKDMIISGGSNIYPREVEEVLLAHADVAEVSVIGRPDRDWGESVVAYIVPRAAGIDLGALDAFCIERIARFKRPRHYRVVAALPKNSYGKVLRTALREMEQTHVT